MIRYMMNGDALILDESTSRACGHLAEFPGESTPDGRSARRAREEVRTDAQILSNTTQKEIDIYASHPKCAAWVVDIVRPLVRR